jgi:Transposase, Mutator family
VRRVEDSTEALWGTRVSPSTVSNLSKKIYTSIEAWRMRPIDVYLDGIVLKLCALSQPVAAYSALIPLPWVAMCAGDFSNRFRPAYKRVARSRSKRRRPRQTAI